MAMEKQYAVKDTHTRAITAIGYNPVRREILIGCEDGVIKTWEAESGRMVAKSHEHRGWVTDFLYWSDAKLMFSAANDGVIVAWSSAGGVHDRIQVGVPVYCMTINPRRGQMVCGVNAGIRVFELDEERHSGHVIDISNFYTAEEHTDIVRCIVCHESRIYSAGYDQKLIIYDSSYTGNKGIEPILINPLAHDAGISCLILVKDNENNTWVVTGSFDKTVKIWSPDGKLVHALDGFLATVTGICYVPRNKTVWAAGGTSYANLFDPKSGDNVSEFIGTFQEQEEEKYHLQILKFFPELNQVVASTSRRHLIVWKYNSSGCITALKCKSAIESLTYTRKVPILLFSGDSDGAIIKWERMQSNHFMYSKEMFVLNDAKVKMLKKKKTEEEEDKLRLQQLQQDIIPPSRERKETKSRYAFNEPIVPPVSLHNHPNTTILKILFVENLDVIVAASEDSNIYVWGFDEAAVQVLKKMKPADTDNLVRKYGILLDTNSSLLPENTKNVGTDNDSVTNRVAGFICKSVLSGHTGCVTCMVVVGREQGYDSTYLLSGGWDRRLCIWDLEAGALHDTFRHPSSNPMLEHIELACDGIILDLAYCPKRNEFAYGSADKMVYIRKFSPTGKEMVLQNTLQGHENDVTCVKWNAVLDKWVTGSEDATIRVWSTEGMNECIQVLSAQGAVSTLCCDRENGAIVAGVQEVIRVYDPEHFRLIQTNVGHSDSVRSIMHLPERKQYVSASWDKTIRIWNAWKMPRRKKKVEEKKEKQTKNSRFSASSVNGGVSGATSPDYGEDFDD